MLQDVASGLVIGLAYSLIALGLSLIFGVLRVVNFAHGEFYMVGGLLLYSLTRRGLGFFPAFAGAVLGTIVLALLVDRVVLKLIRRADEITIALATLGLSIFLGNVALVAWGPIPAQVASPFSGTLVLAGGIHLTTFQLFSGALTVAITLGLHLVIQRTSAGRQIRAVVQDRDAAALVGLDVDLVYSLTFAAGCGLAAVAGGSLGTMFVVYPSMGLPAVLKAFAVVIIGGMGSLGGAIAGGLLLGVAESFGGRWLPGGYKDIIGFILIVVILIVRPQGLLGAKQVRVR